MALSVARSFHLKRGHTLVAQPCGGMQAFAKLSEDKVTVKVREADQGLAKEAIESARSKYKDAFSRDGPTANVDTQTFLPAGPTGKEGEAESSW